MAFASWVAAACAAGTSTDNEPDGSGPIDTPDSQSSGGEDSSLPDSYGGNDTGHMGHDSGKMQDVDSSEPMESSDDDTYIPPTMDAKADGKPSKDSGPKDTGADTGPVTITCAKTPAHLIEYEDALDDDVLPLCSKGCDLTECCYHGFPFKLCITN